MKILNNSHSQSGQESFVLHMLDFKSNGTYLEIGAWDGIELSNTYLLESEYGWTGIALDIVEEYVTRYNDKRKNICILADATNSNFEELLLQYHYPKTIDYLQLDIEPAQNTYECLMRIPFNKIQIGVITFEHDLYMSPNNQIYKDKAFQYLESLGYIRIADNVKNCGNAYEDWYVNPELIPKSRIEILKSNVNFSEHFDC
jgi:hypothetical protein